MPPIRGANHGAKTGAAARAAPIQRQLPLQKKFGQHLLKNPGILDKIMDAGDIKSSDIVFEVGPGTGNLTMRMLGLGKTVIAQEIDPRMAAEVKKRAQNEGRSNLIVREGDCLKADWPPFNVCIANLPYQISSPFTFKLLAHKPMMRCAVIMFQKEFAERLVAEPGENFYGRLALNCRLYAKVTRVCKVSKGSFNPPPEVDSMVVKFTPRNPPIDVDFREWDGLMRIVFCRKRKTLLSSFKTKNVVKLLANNYQTYCSMTNTKPQCNLNSKNNKDFEKYMVSVLEETELGTERAISLDLDTFFSLLLAFNKKGIHFSNSTEKLSNQEALLEQAFNDMDEDANNNDDNNEDMEM